MQKKRRWESLRFLSDAVQGIYVSLGGCGACFGRSVPIRSEDGDRDGVPVRSACSRWHAADARHARSEARGCGPGAGDITAFSDFSRGFRERSFVDIAGDHLRGASGRPVVGFLVSRRGTGGGDISRNASSALRMKETDLLSVLWFNLAALRAAPLALDFDGPAAVVLTGSCAARARLYVGSDPPDAATQSGILLAGFMAAFMSTVPRNLNWGQFLSGGKISTALPGGNGRGKRSALCECVTLATAFLVLAAAAVAWQTDIRLRGLEDRLELGRDRWRLLAALVLGGGRERVSEISAMIAALVTTLALHNSALWNAIAGSRSLQRSDPVIFAKTTLAQRELQHWCGSPSRSSLRRRPK